MFEINNMRKMNFKRKTPQELLNEREKSPDLKFARDHQIEKEEQELKSSESPMSFLEAKHFADEWTIGSSCALPASPIRSKKTPTNYPPVYQFEHPYTDKFIIQSHIQK